MAPEAEVSVSDHRFAKATPYLILAAPLMFFMPTWLATSPEAFRSVPVNLLADGEIRSTLLRSLLFSVASGFAAASLAFVAGLYALGGRIRVYQYQKVLLLLPFFLGDASIGFIVRRAFDSPWLAVSTTDLPLSANLALLGGLQVWRFGCLFTFVLLALNQTMPRQDVFFFQAHQLSRLDMIRSLVCPRTVKVFQLCACIGFAASMVESAKSQFIFRASQGNALELLDHWIWRRYEASARISLETALDLVNVLTFVLFLVLAVIGLCVVGAARCVLAGTVWSLGLAPGYRAPVRVAVMPGEALCFWFLVLTSGIVAVVILGKAAPALVPGVLAGLSSAQPYVGTLALAALASVVASGVAALCAVLMRIVWARPLGDLSLLSRCLITGLTLFTALPTTFVMIAAYHWAIHIVGTRGASIAWLVGHITLVLPILAAFYMVAHFAVKTEEIEFSLLHRAPVRSIVRLNFMLRFAPVYVVGAFCGICVIWNEHMLNSAFAYEVPSLSSALLRAIDSRAANSDEAAFLICISLVLGIASSTFVTREIHRIE